MIPQRLKLKLISKLPGSLIVKLAGGTPLEVGGHTLAPMIQSLAKQAEGLPSITEFTPEQARAGMEAGFAALQSEIRTMRSTRELGIPTEDGDELECRILTPYDVADPSPMIVYYYQGGCVLGGIDLAEPFCSMLAAETGCRVLMVDYRRAPEHKFPTAAEDAIAALDFVMQNTAGLDVDPERVLVAGDSAGGGLAAVVCQTMKAQRKPMPCAQVLIYPWLQALADENESYREHENAYPLTKAAMQWFNELYLNTPEDADDIRVSPLLNEDLAGLPQALIYTAGFDPLRDEGEHYAKKLQAANVQTEYTCHHHLSHSFTAFGGVVPEAMKACLEIAGDIRRVVEN